MAYIIYKCGPGQYYKNQRAACGPQAAGWKLTLCIKLKRQCIVCVYTIYIVCVCVYIYIYIHTQTLYIYIYMKQTSVMYWFSLLQNSQP